MLFVENVIPTLNACLNEGQKIALATLVGIEGASPRPVGSQIGVAADGRSVGMITGGCAEKAIVAEALRCIERAENKIARYGAGSPYLDVVLPCGSGIDLYIETKAGEELVPDIYARLKDRKQAFVTIDLQGLSSRLSDGADEHGGAAQFVKSYEPDYRVFAFGEGTNLASFCTLASAAGLIVEAFSPDEETLQFLKCGGVEARHIHRKTDFAVSPIDAYTAVVTLFHEHEWEREILHAALNSPADYVGALGSRATHRARLEALAELPVAARAPDIIRGPVGLDIGAQNPNEIAVSIIAEIVEHRRCKAS